MESIDAGQSSCEVQGDQGKSPEAGGLVSRLKLPEEVTACQAAQILSVSKHTALQFLEDGLLEWRNAAPPSSSRPVYRITLRSVLRLRLEYKSGSARPPAAPAENRRRKPRKTSAYEAKHLRRKKQAMDGERSKES
jgi:hypothetical protein